MNISKKQGWIIVYTILALVVILIAGGSWVKFGPKPLDDQAIYLGNHGYGCLFPLCASEPVDEFYYATNMTIDELRNDYFSKGKVQSESYNGQNTGKQFWSIVFLNIETNEKFYVTYYPDGKKLAQGLGLDLKGRSSLIMLTNRPNYNIVKKSL